MSQGQVGDSQGQVRDSQGVGSLTLAYRVKLYPSRVKGDMLGMLCTLFQREHHKALDLLDGIVAQEGKLSLKGKSQAGAGEFKQRVRYRAANDYKRARKAAQALKRQMKLPTCRQNSAMPSRYKLRKKPKSLSSGSMRDQSGTVGDKSGTVWDCLYLPARIKRSMLHWRDQTRN